MDKKILIGSMLVLTLLLMMPSIPAIQQKTIEEKAYSDLSEQLDLKDVKEIKELLLIKHPLLYALIIATLISRYTRLIVLKEYSCKITPGWHGWFFYIEVKNRVLFLRFISLGFTTVCWWLLWECMSEKFGWNWVIPECP